MTRVLVVEDEPLIAMALEAALQDVGFLVSMASNGKQALARLAEQPLADIVLLDMMMPVMSGPAMLEVMREDPVLNAIPVIILSSLPLESTLARVGGGLPVIRKPYTIKEVLRVMRLELDRAAQSHRQAPGPGA
jgi:CheY-like chemotaxis protein